MPRSLLRMASRPLSVCAGHRRARSRRAARRGAPAMPIDREKTNAIRPWRPGTDARGPAVRRVRSPPTLQGRIRGITRLRHRAFCGPRFVQGRGNLAPSRAAYLTGSSFATDREIMEKVINCPCGFVLKGASDEEVVGQGAGARQGSSPDGSEPRAGARDGQAGMKKALLRLSMSGGRETATPASARRVPTTPARSASRLRTRRNADRRPREIPIRPAPLSTAARHPVRGGLRRCPCRPRARSFGLARAPRMVFRTALRSHQTDGDNAAARPKIAG